MTTDKKKGLIKPLFGLNNEPENGVPVLKLRCKEAYFDSERNQCLFSKNYVYHVFKVKVLPKSDFILYMQTNFVGDEAEITKDIAKKIFHGF